LVVDLDLVGREGPHREEKVCTNRKKRSLRVFGGKEAGDVLRADGRKGGKRETLR